MLTSAATNFRRVKLTSIARPVPRATGSKRYHVASNWPSRLPRGGYAHRTSVVGQTRKYSLGADVCRFTVGRRHLARIGCGTTDLPVGRCCKKSVQPPSQKYFCFSETQISSISLPSRPTEGRCATSRNAERDAVDADSAVDDGAKSGRRSRVVLTPRRWRQVPGKQASRG